MRHFAAKPFTYVGPNGLDARCDIETIELDDGDNGAVGRCVIIATERADNGGQSVTNSAELLATLVCHVYEIAPSRIVWIEHYTEDSYRAAAARALIGGRVLAAGPRETFDLVTFKHVKGRGPSEHWPNCGWHFDFPLWQPMERVYWLELGLPAPGTVKS